MGKPVSCWKCLQLFSTKNRLVAHIDANVGCQIKRFACAMCPQVFVTKTGLISHQKAHQNKVSGAVFCEYCRKKFKNVCTLNVHVHRYHPKKIEELGAKRGEGPSEEKR